jgi:L-lactate utilization protein LutC
MFDPVPRSQDSITPLPAKPRGGLFVTWLVDLFLPDTHVVALEESDIVGDDEEVWQRLRRGYGKDRMSRTINTIAGPSRTGEIERTIEFGAHGPQPMHIVVVRG